MDEYVPADIVDFILADGSTRVERRIESVSYQDTADGLIWTVEGGSAAAFVGASGGRTLSFGAGETSRALGGSSSEMKVMGEAVRTMLEEFRFDEDPEIVPVSITGGGGGVPTVYVVASDATDKSKAMADYQCSGVSDQLTIHEARDFLSDLGGGRLVFSEGEFTCDTVGIDAANDPILDLFGDITYQGMAAGQSFGTIVTVAATTQNGAADSAAIRVGASGFTTIRDVRFDYTGNADVGDGDPSYFFALKLMGFAHMLNTIVTGTGDNMLSVVAVDSGIENIIDVMRIQGSTTAEVGPDNLLRFVNGSAWTFINNLHAEDCRSHGILIETLESGHILCNIKLEDVVAGTANTFDGVHIQDGASEGSQTRQILISNLVVDSAQHRSALFIGGVNTKVGYTNIVSNGHDTAIVMDGGRPAGGQNRAVEVATATTVYPYSGIYNVDSAGGIIALTMPDNAEAQGAIITVVRDGGNNVTVARAGADTFSDGTALLTLGTDNTAVQLISIGDTEWKILTPSTVSAGAGVDHDDLSNVTTDQHHTEAHTVASHSDTTGTGAELDTLTDGSNADALHVHAAAGVADALIRGDVATNAFAAATTDALRVQVTADGNDRFVLDANGDMWTGTGAAAVLLSMRLSVAGSTTLGRSAGAVNTATNITAVGFEALKANTTGAQNLAIGYRALLVNTTAANNTAVGYAALTANTSGANNTAIGRSALAANGIGTDNTAVGYLSLDANTDGIQNTAIGSDALGGNTTGVNNTAIGYVALFANTTGGNNTAVGFEAMTANTTGGQNLAFGAQTLKTNTTGANNTAIGWAAMLANLGGSNNSAIGRSALAANTAGTDNTAMGYLSLDVNLTGIENTAVGSQTLGGNTASANTAIGYVAMFTNTSAANNVAVGHSALTNNSTGTLNTAVGYQALKAVTGSNGTAVGAFAGFGITSGANNVAIGERALQNPSPTTTGADNVAVGARAGQGSATQRNRSVAIGRAAEFDADDAVALGRLAKANHDDSVALGANLTTTATLQVEIGGTHIEMSEVTAPGAGAANSARLYAVDDGGGKTNLVVIFASGAAQVIAAEP